MRRAARAVPLLAAAAITAAGPMAGSAGNAQTGAPQIFLMTPANGALVDGRKPITFSWRVEWPRPPAAGTVMVVHRLAADPAFTQQVSTNTQSCSVSNVNCWTSFRPNATHSGRYFWQVSIMGAAQATSATWIFQASDPVEVDRTRPYVRAYSGSAKRGQRAFFTAQVRDNTGEARMRALLTYRGLPVLEGRTNFAAVVWRVRQRFYSIRALPRRLPVGIYKICITAWDRAGNQGRSCARYRVR